MKKPFFSIITCTYNSKRFLKQNINSVKSQTFRDYEHIFIDGQSSDNTMNIIKNYAREDERVRFFVYPPRGVSNAFNRGIKCSKGNYIFFLNSDDFFCDSNVLLKVYKNLLINSNIDWFYGKIREIDVKGRIFGIFPRQKLFHTSNYTLLKFINFIPHQSVFMRREVFTRFGYFDEKMRYLMDYDYWLRVGKKTSWKFMDILVANYRNWYGSNSSSKIGRREMNEEVWKLNKRYLNLFERTLFLIIFKIVSVCRIMMLIFKKKYITSVKN